MAQGSNSVRRGRDVVVLGATDWQPLWQQAQALATRLAQAGNRVVYVENMGVRAPRPRDLARVRSRLRSATARGVSTGVRQVAPRLHVVSPLLLPPLGAGLARALNRRILLSHVQHAIERLGIRDPALVSYLPTDTAFDLIARLRTPRSHVVYCCTADFAQLARHPERLRAAERRLLEHSDVVLAMVPALAEYCARTVSPVHLFPPAVDLATFSPVAAPCQPDGAPVIGYVGGVHRHLDLDLLASLARSRPAWRFVCVGPLQRRCDQLAGLPNVSLLGARPHAHLPGLIEAFDVCLVPYLRNAATRAVWPTKLFEYLAMGKPVVSTALPAIVDLSQRFPGAVSIAPHAHGEFGAAIEAALDLDDPTRAAGRRRLAAVEGSWDARMATLCPLIDAAHGEQPSEIVQAAAGSAGEPRRGTQTAVA